MKTQALVALIASTAQATTCGEDVAQIFLTTTASAEALTCAKESGVSLASTRYTEMDLTKALATPSCLSYWDGVVMKVHAVSPACDFPSPLNDGSTLNTATFKWTLLALSAPPTANSTALISGSSTSPTWGNSTNSTTIIAPRPDNIKPGASGNSSPSPAKPTTTPQSLSSAFARVSFIVVVGVVLLA
ncbi:hypothetical protein AeRB84_001650 [Aphanomyces euteiches]|nr:hypothetical protein AeRB84_001650 [Aphanomyces euteiches]